MTRTTKANDLPHNNPDVALLITDNHYPKFFAKSGWVDTDPSKTKKDGGGKGNWGQPGDEIEDLEEFNMTRPRRYSNASPTSTRFDLKTKFEIHEEEPLFDDRRHGPADEEVASNDASTDSASAGSSGSGEVSRP